MSFPAPGRRVDAADAILFTLAVLVFCTGAAMTFSQMAAIRTAARRLAVVLPVTTVGLPVLAWLASRLVSGVALRGGILSAGIAPAEVASVAMTGLVGGDTVLAAGLLPYDTVVTHEFPLDSYRDALSTAIDRGGSGAIKVVLRP